MFLFDKGSSLSCDGHHRFFDGLGFRVYIIGFLTGWSYFSMSFDGLATKVDCDWLSCGM